MNENLDQLRQVAERATPGNWMWVNDREDEHVRAGKFPYTHVTYTADVEDVNALHIATFDPPTVLALIERVEAAEAAMASQRGVVKTLAERNVELTKFKDAYSLQAQELEQAEAERDFRQKENKELFEQIERVRELNRFLPASIMERIIRALDGGEQSDSLPAPRTITGEQVNRAGWTCYGIHEPGNYATCEECREACDDLANFYNNMHHNQVAPKTWTGQPTEGGGE